MKIVDFETHVVPAHVLRQEIGQKWLPGNPSQEGMVFWRHQPEPDYGETVFNGLSNIDLRLKVMNEAGIDMAVLTSNAGWNASLDGCKYLNDILAGLVEKYPGKFITLGHLDPLAGTAAIQELRRIIEDLGMPGIGLSTVIGDGVLADDRRLWRFYEEAAALGAVVYFHPSLGPSTYSLAPEFAYHPTLVREFDLATTVARLVFGGVTANFPEMKIVISHLGGAIGAVKERLIAGGPSQGLTNFEEGFSKLYFTMSGASGGKNFLKLGLMTIAPDKMLFATDYPHNLGTAQAIRRYVTMIEELDLPHESIQGMLGQNALSLLGIANNK